MLTGTIQSARVTWRDPGSGLPVAGPVLVFAFDAVDSEMEVPRRPQSGVGVLRSRPGAVSRSGHQILGEAWVLGSGSGPFPWGRRPVSECLVLGLELAWVHRQIVDEPPVAGDERLGLGRLGVAYDAEAVEVVVDLSALFLARVQGTASATRGCRRLVWSQCPFG